MEGDDAENNNSNNNDNNNDNQQPFEMAIEHDGSGLG